MEEYIPKKEKLKNSEADLGESKLLGFDKKGIFKRLPFLKLDPESTNKTDEDLQQKSSPMIQEERSRVQLGLGETLGFGENRR